MLRARRELPSSHFPNANRSQAELVRLSRELLKSNYQRSNRHFNSRITRGGVSRIASADVNVKS